MAIFISKTTKSIVQDIGSVRIFDLCLSFLFAFTFFAMLFQRLESDIQFFLRVAAVFSSGLLMIIELLRGKRGTQSIVIAFILSIFVVIDAVFVGAKAPLALMQMYISLVLAVCLISERLLPCVARFMFWLVIALMAYLYTISGVVFEGQGRNYCGAYALIAFFLLCSSLKNKSDKAYAELLISAIACLIISLYATGRGSILSCVLLIGLFLIIVLIKNKTSSVFLIAAVLAVALCISLLILEAIDNDIVSTLFSRFGSDSAERSDSMRSAIYSDYLSIVLSNSKNLLLGINPLTIPNQTILMTGGNLHCSYLQWHANFGLLGLGLLLAISVKGIIVLYRKKHFYLLAAVIAILVRAISDALFVGGLWDIVVFYLAFVCFDKNRNSIDLHSASSRQPESNKSFQNSSNIRHLAS